MLLFVVPDESREANRVCFRVDVLPADRLAPDPGDHDRARTS